MGLEYKVWQLPIDQRAILINPQKGTAGSASGIDKMQSKDKEGWEYCMIMLIKTTSSHGPWPTAEHWGLGFWFLLFSSSSSLLWPRFCFQSTRELGVSEPFQKQLKLRQAVKSEAEAKSLFPLRDRTKGEGIRAGELPSMQTCRQSGSLWLMRTRLPLNGSYRNVL